MASDAEHVLDTINRLFHMVPGTDEYDPNWGLNIAAQKFIPHDKNGRNSQYENDILTQLGKYTDLTAKTVTARYYKDNLVVLMDIMYKNKTYMVSISSEPDSLATIVSRNPNIKNPNYTSY